MFMMFIYFLYLDFVPGKRDVRDGDERKIKNSRKFTIYLKLFDSVFFLFENLGLKIIFISFGLLNLL